MNQLIFPINQTPHTKPIKEYVVILTSISYKDKEPRTYQLEFDTYKDAIKQMKDWASERGDHQCLIDTSSVVGLFNNNGQKLICWKQVLLTSYDMQ